MIAIASLAAALAIGFLLVRALLPPPEGTSSVLFLAGCGAALGFGIDSLVFFALTVSGMAGAVWLGLAQGLLLAAALGLSRKYVLRARERKPKFAGWHLSPAAKAAALVLSIELVLTLVSFFNISHVNPHGFSDAWAIYNLRARYLAGGDATWHYAVSRYIILQHPDYPLLTSSVIALAWKAAGSMSATAPIAVALLFLLATVVVLVAGVVSLRGVLASLCAGAMLLAVPVWLQSAAAQHADVPVGFYFLVTLALLCHSGKDNRFALLAGITVSLAAWTKDEGVMFTAICLVVTLVLFGTRRAFTVLAGASPILLFLVWYKLRIAPGVDPMWRQGAGVILAKLADGGRYATIAAQFAKDAAALPELLLLPLFGLALGFQPNRRTLACFAVIGLMLVGYFGYYVVTPYPLEWQLRSSLDRLYLQLLPGFLLGWFQAGSAGASGDASSRPPHGRGLLAHSGY